MATSLGHSNVNARSELAKFVLKFSDSFIHVLTSRQMDLKMLEELKLVTCLLSRVAPFEALVFEQTDSYQVIEFNSALTRIKKEFINLINFYYVPDQLKLIRRDVEKIHQGDTSALRVCNSLLVNISLNLSTFLTVSLRPELTWTNAIFDTSVEYYDSSSSSYNLNSRNVSIGLLLNFLKMSVESLEKSVDIACDLVSKEKNLYELVELEKKQLIVNLKAFERMSEVEKGMYLKNVIRQKLKANKVNLENL